MKNSEIFFAVILAVAIGVALMFGYKKGLKVQLGLLIIGTAYMVVHAILHPETNSKFFAFIGLIFIVQRWKEIRQRSQ